MYVNTGPWWAVLFGGVMEPLGGGSLLGEVYHWGEL